MSGLLRRWRRRDENPSRGFTLIELTVVMAVLGGIVTMVTAALIVAFQTLNRDTARLDATAQSKTAIEAMSRSLRTAIMPSQLKGTCPTCDNAAFITGDNTSVMFYANVDNDTVTQQAGLTDSGPAKVRYELFTGTKKLSTGENANCTATCLLETITRPKPHAVTDYVYNWCDSGQTGCAVRQRILARNVAQAGTPLFTYYDRTGTTLPVPLQANVTRLRSVDSVDLLLKMRVNDRVATETTSMRVTLPNADSLIQTSPTPSP